MTASNVSASVCQRVGRQLRREECAREINYHLGLYFRCFLKRGQWRWAVAALAESSFLTFVFSCCRASRCRTSPFHSLNMSNINNRDAHASARILKHVLAIHYTNASRHSEGHSHKVQDGPDGSSYLRNQHSFQQKEKAKSIHNLHTSGNISFTNWTAQQCRITFALILHTLVQTWTSRSMHQWDVQGS